jgi:hypothetical protein
MQLLFIPNLHQCKFCFCLPYFRPCSQHIPGWARGVHPLLLEALAACEVDVPGKGRVALRDLTTREVVAHAIKPWTQSKRPASYVEVVNSGG